MNYTEKAAKMNEEILDFLRNKPVESTLVERMKLIDQAITLYGDLPQPLKLGYGIAYILNNASQPIKEYDIILGRFDDHVPNEEEEAFIENFRDTDRQQLLVDGGHITLDWAKLIKIGIDGYIKQAEDEYECRMKRGKNSSTLLFYSGSIIILKAIKDFILRYSETARINGLYEAASCARSIAGPAPSGFYSAMQLIAFMEKIYYIYVGSINPTLTLGRLDDLLCDLYESDIASGQIDEVKAAAIIDDFNAKCNLILGRGEHQMSENSASNTGWWRNSAYDDPTYVVIGGHSFRCDSTHNPLTKLFASRINPRYENPVYIYRYSDKTSRNNEAWNIILDKLRQNASILVYNDETVIPAFENAGIMHEDAIDYTMHGCNWPDIPAKYSVVRYAGGSIAQMTITSIFNTDNDKIIPRHDFKSIDEIYTEIGSCMRRNIRSVFDDYRAIYYNGNSYPQAENLSVTEIFTEGVLESGCNAGLGGVKYPVVYTLVRHVATAADIMASIEKNVFCDKSVTLDELAKAMEKNWQGEEFLQKLCITSPKYGTDDDYADKHANRLMKMMLDIIDEEAINKEGVRDVISLNVTITDMVHIYEGSLLPASPEGRMCGAPLSENLSPTAGCNDSVTALLNSVVKLPLNRICSGALNVRLSKSLVAGDDGYKRLMILADDYFERGGMQMQVSVTDTSELRDAQLHPSNYKDLMVRITGYSASFTDMCTHAQNEIIRRDELS